MRRMLRHFVLSMAAIAASGGAMAQNTTVLDYEFGSTSTFVMTPTTRHNNVVPGDPLLWAGNQMASVPRFNTSGNSGGFVEYNNWPTSETGAGTWATGTRTSINPTLAGPTLWTRFTLGPNSSFSLSNATVQFRYQRTSSTAPRNVRACLTWFDGSTYRRRYSATTNLSTSTSTSSWQSGFNVRIGGTGSAGDSLPIGSAMSGKTFLLEMQFFGGTSTSNKIHVDDVMFLADSAVTGSVGWITPATLPAAERNTPYFMRLQAGSGNVSSYSYSLTSGTLPGGLSLSSGNILGTPTGTAGNYTFTIRASTGSATANRTFSLTLNNTAAGPTGANLAVWSFDSDTSAETLSGPSTMSASLKEVTWGFDKRNSILPSLHVEGTAAASSTPITPDRSSSGDMRAFSGWEAGDSYTATRNSLLHVVDTGSGTTNWRFHVTPTENTASIPPSSYVTTGEINVLQFSMTFRATAAGNLRAFKADMLRWLRGNMSSDGTPGPRYARLYAYYTNDAGTVQRWTGDTIDIDAVYSPEMQNANQNQFRTFWWDLSSLDAAINATTAKYSNRKVAFELYPYYEHGQDSYLAPAVLLDDVAVTGDFVAPTLSIGNLVWEDLNYNGVKDASEPGLAGAQVELFTPGADNAIGGTGANADTKVGTTITTTATGAYTFSVLDPGTYYVRVTPPATHVITGGAPDTEDNGQDNDNNGMQPGGRGTPLYSPVINLAVNAEPTDDGDTDNLTDYSVDFGICRGLGVGNLVFIDNDDSGHFNAGDSGVSGAKVQLFDSNNNLVATTTTSTATTITGFQVRQVKSSTDVRNYTQAMEAINGTNQTDSWLGTATRINYLESGGTDGRYTSGNSAFPDGVSSNFVVRATGTVTIPSSGTWTFGMTLDDGGRLRVNNQDVIVDEAGLHSVADRLGRITLNAGTYPIEMVYWGVNAGSVELYARSGSYTSWSTSFKLVGDTGNGGLAVSHSDSATGGRYLIDGLAAGNYYVKIPASEFLTGKPLYGYKSVRNGTPAYSLLDDDSGINGSDNGIDAPAPGATGVRTSTFSLAPGAEPTGGSGETGTGSTSDDATDADTDLTVDLGFHTEQEGCFYVRIIDTDRDGVPLIQRLDGSTQSANLLFGGAIANIDRAQFAYDTRSQRLDVQYIFHQWTGKKVRGFYLVLTDAPTPAYENTAAIMYVDVYNRASPKVTVMKYQGPEGGQTSYVTPGQLLESSITNPNFCTINVVESGSSLTVTIGADMSRVNNGNLWTSYGVNPANWGGMVMGKNAGIWCHAYDLSGAPAYNSEGKLTSWPRRSPDSSWWNYLSTYNAQTITTESPCGTIMTIGNMVFDDADDNGVFTAGEGVDNVLVYLFTEGKNPLVDTPAAAVLTTGGGQYAFTGLSTGRYFVHIPPSEFQAGGPLFGKVSVPDSGDDAAADDHVDENGIDAAFPAVTGISTSVIVLTENGEPSDTVEAGAFGDSDNDDDNNGDLTADLGFRDGANLTLGNLVWNDTNGNGTKQGGESGVPGVTVDLFTPGDDDAIGGSGSAADMLVATTTTNASGNYSFSIPSPGRYYVRVTPPSALPATTSNVVIDDAGDDDDNNGAQPGGEFTFIYSPVITLTENGEPGTGGATGVENTIDFGLRTAQKLSVGNLVFLDNNNNGRYDSGDGGVGGVRVQLFNTSNVLLQETSTVAPAQLPGWRFQQAKASVAVQSIATAEAVMLGTNRSSFWTGTTNFINHVTSSSNNGWQDYGHAGNGKLLPNGSMENVVVLGIGTLNIPVGDNYSFIINTDDGGRLKIDGSQLIVDDGTHASRDAAGSLVLSAGPHSIEFLGYENTGGGGFEVWAKRGIQTTWDEGFRLIGDTGNGGLEVTYPGSAPDTGRYRFNNINPGSYYVKIPSTEFGAGGPLEGRLSFVQSTPPSDDQKDDNSTSGSADSGVDAAKPAISGISSHTFALGTGVEPAGSAESGFFGSEDDAADTNGDMTIDFAFDGTRQVVAGCYRFNMKDLDKNCNFSAVEEIDPDQGWDFGYNNGNNGPFFYFTDWDMLFDADKDRLTMDVTFEQVNGRKVDSFWICVTPGPAPHTDNSAIIYVNGINRGAPKLTVYKYTTSLGEESWKTSSNCLLTTAGNGINASDVLNLSVTETGANVRFKFTLSTARINNANNWSVVTNKSAWVGAKFYSRAGVWFHPMDNSSTWTYDSAGRITAADTGWPNQGWLDTDEAGTYSIRTELCPTLTVGDSVWNDQNNNGVKEAGEAGIDGVFLELWTPGTNGTRENGGGDDVKIADVVSFNSGFYQFEDILAGVYYVRIPNPPASFPLASSIVTTTDNSVNNDNNGAQTGGQGTAILSPLFTLTVGAEPGGVGSNEDTMDFGLRVVPTTDFGDWNGTGAATLTTTSTANNLLRLGATVDVEPTITPNAAATGDDTLNTGSADDEDGVTMPLNITQGAIVTLPVSVFNNTGDTAYLHSWIDFDNDGTLANNVISLGGERLGAVIPVSSSASMQTVNVTFQAPVTASIGTQRGVRFRLTNLAGTTPTGVSGTGEIEDYVVGFVAPTLDFGDHEDLADASSTRNGSLRLGALVDAEGAATKNAAATGDDTTDSDDEDGVTIPQMTAGQPVVVQVNVTNSTGSTAYLNAWFDFNDNGVLTDAGEQIATNVSVTSGTSNGTVNLGFTVPAAAVTTSSVAARFRLTNNTTPGSTGASGTGEVEDYAVTILNATTDSGDFSGFANAVNTASSNLRLGALVDAEYTATTNATATGDDLAGNDDEDGVTLPALTAGAPASATFVVTNVTGSTAYLNAWIDFNNNGSAADTGEQIATNLPISNGANNSTQNLSINVPAAAVTGTNLGVRFRLTTNMNPGFGTVGGVGEVEDYVVNIAAPTTDFGDLTLFGHASSTQSSGLRLGALIDTEYTPTTNTTATGDDTTGVDDEDAVTISPMIAGGPGSFPVLVTNTTGSTAYLNAWIDYNGNGVLTDAGEQVATNVAIPTDSNNITQTLNFTVAPAALTGVNLGARFRLTSTSGAAPTGHVGNGEVEDYVLILTAPTTDFGDFSSFADASQGVNPSLRIGTSVDAEYEAEKNATATGDDTTGTDDEDGVAMPSMTAGQTVVIPVTVTNTTGAPGYLNAWMDFNNNGLLTDNGEFIAENTPVPTGTVNGVVNITVTVPATAATGVNVGTRFRLSAPSGLGPTGANGLAGEIEDHAVVIAAPTTDFGDFNGFADASSLMVPALRLGALVDTEYLVTKNATATGDDTRGVDDEDGVVFPSLTAGQSLSLPVQVTNTGASTAYLNAWIDYNNNGVLTDAGEQFATNVIVPAGSNNVTLNLPVTIPDEAATGVNLGTRLRLTHVTGAPPAGAFGNGEVEDHLVSIAAPTQDFGDFSGFASASNGANSGLRMGTLVDAEFAVTGNSAATGDDTQGQDDEDGVTLPAMTAGGAYNVPVVVTNTLGSTAYLNAWIDFNNNGLLTDPGELVIADTLVPNGTTNATLNMLVSVPPAAVTGVNLGARFRLTSVTTPGPTGTDGGTGEVEDYVLNIAAPTTDFGDYSGFASASSTRLADLRLGALTDTEFAATSNSTATGDDNAGVDDEDGVTLPPLTAGGPATIQVVVTNNTGSTAYLNGWIDYNHNGLLTNPGEQIATDIAIPSGVTGSTQNLVITVPPTAAQGVNLGARFRLTTTSGTLPTGVAAEGEVEDYMVNIATPPSDFGDFNGFADALSTRNPGIVIGTLVDTEFAATRNSLATGDDLNGDDDEDGVTIPAMTAGAPAVLPVVVTNTTAAPAYLNVWIDYNNNGQLTDTGEQVAVNTPVPAGTSAATQNVSFTVPATAVTGANLGIRVRLTSTASPAPIGAAGEGEVEDHIVNIAVPTTDFGDWAGAADASSTHSNNVRMGALVDPEFASTRNASANGDDTTGSDDEDGVTIPTLTRGASSTVVVTVTNLSGEVTCLNAWIDFNADGDFTDSGEQIAADILIPDGTNALAQNITVNTPADAVPGNRGARFRLSSTTSPGPVGHSGTGEVEDHLAVVNCPVLTVTTESLAAGRAGTAYSQSLSGGGGLMPYTWSVASGTLPGGLTLSSGGLISGTPAASNGAGVPVTLRFTDSWGCTTTKAFNLKICPVITLTAPPLAAATVTLPYSQTITAIGGAAPYVHAVTSGALPDGLTLSPAGVLSGTPTSRATATFTVTATDANGCTGSQSYTVTPACPVITVGPATLPNGTVGSAYAQTITATGGTTPHVFAVTAGALPDGLTFTSTGTLSGTPTSIASQTFTVTATDALGCTGTRTYTIVPDPNTDFGDFSGFGMASNTFVPGLRLGALLDVEGTATPNSGATGDDITGVDDEDGVSFPSMTSGQAVTIPVTVTNTTGAPAYLNLWFDFNDNGLLNESGEQVAVDVPVPAGTTNTTLEIDVAIPPSTVTSSSIGVRARLTGATGTPPTGAGSVGEVEDYLINVLNPTTDFGDWSGAAEAANSATTNLRLGAKVDAEYAPTKNATATGDDITGDDDEDGVSFSSMTAGGPATLSAIVTNTTGGTGYLNAWIDFNNDGDFEDAGEYIVANQTVPNGANSLTQTPGYTVPPAALTGTPLGARVRLTSTGTPGPTGVGGPGEVEDYIVTIAEPTTDFGDFALFGSASSTRDDQLRLGTLIDTEYSATVNSTGTGDDNTRLDDEDGVSFPVLIAGGPAVITATVTNNRASTAYLNAWIDFNNNGVLTDAGEKIATNVAVPAGTVDGEVEIPLNVPATALTGVSIGTRFRLTSTSGAAATGAVALGEVEDHAIVIQAPTTDFGDFSGFADASQGANPVLRLGTLLDTEYSPTKNSTATGDDGTGDDDEDGVTFPSMTAGQTVTIPVTITNGTGATAYLNAWFDFNNNGSLTDGGEHVAANLTIPTGTTDGIFDLSVTIPSSAVTGTNVGARFRLSAPSGLGPTGDNGLAGEVEDYVVSFAVPTTDFGDYDRFANASSTRNSNLRLGALTDTEYAAAKNATATSDDLAGTDDEDGVTFPTLTAGAPATIPVIVTNNTGSTAYLNVWIDYNNDGDVLDLGERIGNNLSITTGTTNSPRNLSITVPPGAVTGVPVGVRVRLTSTSNPGSTGHSGNGEVEDYTVVIESPITDFGDFSGFTNVSNAANSLLRLGATVDTEFAATLNSTATGDDITTTDDEDGVTIPALTSSGIFTVPVVVTNETGAGAFLNAWFDFNNNGVLTDSGEHVAANVPVSAGLTESTLNLTVPVPPAAVTGTNLGARFRLTANSSPGATTSSSIIGEIEDYVVNITAPTRDHGDFSGLAVASSTRNGNLRIGAAVDAEHESLANATATGDDTTGTDDEDGVTIPILTAGAPATISVLVTNNTGSTGYLNGWIDFNNNGVLTDAGERIISNNTVSGSTSNATRNVNITVPAGAVTGVPLGARFRLSSSSSTTSTGHSGNGEVEDYAVTILAPPSDYGDFSGFADAFSTKNENLRLGATTDTEYVPAKNTLATGDDIALTDDEDGAVIPSMIAGGPATIPVTVTNNTGAPAYLNLWVNFNNDGDLLDAGEQVAMDILVPDGTTDAVENVSFTVPANAITGANLGIRVRLTSTSTPPSTGASGQGEVEDYVVNIAVPTTDFGDWIGAPDASSTQSNNLRMGALVDTEYAPMKNASANGDDTTGSDDEDGVSIPALTPGTSSTVSITVTNLSGSTGYLNGWIDFNNNGSFDDAGEQIVSNGSIAHNTNGGVQNITVNTPLNAVPGARGARFRFTSTQNPGSTGHSGTGEVEDHMAVVNCLPVSVNPASIANGVVGTPYSQIFTASGGMAPYTFAISSGTLPAGLALNAATGELSGTPTSTTSRTFTIRATDAYGCQGTRGYTVAPVCPVITVAPGSLDAGTVGAAYSQTLSASGGTGPYTFALTSGTLPAGLTLNATTGALSGTPTTANGAGAALTFRATDAHGCTGTVGVTLKICPVINLAAITTSATVGTAYSSNATAGGGVSPYVYAVTSGTLPAGLSLNTSTGAITGTPTSITSQTFTVRAVDANGCPGTRAYTLAPVCPTITISPVLPAAGVVGTAYSQAMTAAGGTSPYSWTTAAGVWPDGLSLGTDGVISGTPTAANGAGVNVTVRATDALGCTRDLALTVKICPVISLSAVSTTITAGTPYSSASTASGGLSPYVYSISSGALPAGLSLNSSTGAISGTPTSTATRVFTIRAVDANGCAGTRSHTLTPGCPELVISPASLPTGFPGAGYSQTLLTSGGGAPYTYSISGGSLPGGLTLSSAGVISGAPSGNGTFVFTVSSQDSYGCSTSRELSIHIKSLAVGDLVFEDSNNNGVRDAGEPGVAGALVQLFNPGADNAVGGTGTTADTQIGADVTTGADGRYSFSGLAAGYHYIKVTPPVHYVGTGGTPATTDNNINDNNDGQQPGGHGTPIFSPVFHIAEGAESITDGDSDPDTNLTIDFGLWSPMAVGNAIFLDINGNGRRDLGESLGSIYVELYPAGATPGVSTPAGVGATGCSCEGTFLISGLNPGNYFLHIPASLFAPGGPLEDLFPMASATAGDDNTGQDLLYNNNPAVNGASTAVFSLRPGQCPVGSAESGHGGSLDDDADSITDLTRDLGLATASGTGYPSSVVEYNILIPPDQVSSRMPGATAPSSTVAVNSLTLTFASWSQAQALSCPLADSDGDNVSNLLEYALGTDPRSGLTPARFTLEADSWQNTLSAVVTRPVEGRGDLRYVLEAATSLEQGDWKPLNLPAAATFNSDGTVTRRYSGIAPARATLGFLRLRIDLDADLNGTPEFTTTTSPHAWAWQSFTTGARTFSMPLMQPAVYTGPASFSTGGTLVLSTPLQIDTPHELEILDGTHKGLCLTLPATRTSTTIHHLSAASLPTGTTRVSVRPHHTLGALLPAASLAEEDLLLAYDPRQNTLVPAAADAPFAAHQGVLVKVSGPGLTRILTGEVRSIPIAIPLVSGTQLISLGSLGTSIPVNDLQNGSSPETADRLRLWNADSGINSPPYSSWYLKDGFWTSQATTPLLEPGSSPFRAFFLIRSAPLLWQPRP
jgi:hypothetical protein